MKRGLQFPEKKTQWITQHSWDLILDHKTSSLTYLPYRIMYSTVFLSLKVSIHCEQYQNKFLYKRYSIHKEKMYELHIFFL